MLTSFQTLSAQCLGICTKNVLQAVVEKREEATFFIKPSNVVLPTETKPYVENFITLNVIFYKYELFIKNKLNFTAEKMMTMEAMEISTTEQNTENFDK